MSDEQTNGLLQAIFDAKVASREQSAASDEHTGKLLEALLEVEVESFEQTTTYTLLSQREAALNAVHRRIIGLEGASTSGDLLYSMIMSGLGGIGTLLLDRILDDLGVSPDIKLSITVTIALVLVGWVGYIAFKLVAWLRQYGKRQSVKRMLQQVSEAYGAHSIRDLRQQEGRQRRVAREALLRPMLGKPWEEIAAAGHGSRIRDAVKELAEIEAQRLADTREYLEKGGEYVLKLLEACSRDEVPAYVGTYLIVGLDVAASLRNADTNPIREEEMEAQFQSWKNAAIEYLAVLQEFGGRFGFRAPTVEAARQLSSAIDAVVGFHKTGIQALVESCSQAPYFFRGPRGAMPDEFVFVKDDENAAQTLLNLARASEKAGRRDDALRRLTQILADFPKTNAAQEAKV